MGYVMHTGTDGRTYKEKALQVFNANLFMPGGLEKWPSSELESTKYKLEGILNLYSNLKNYKFLHGVNVIKVNICLIGCKNVVQAFKITVNDDEDNYSILRIIYGKGLPLKYDGSNYKVKLKDLCNMLVVYYRAISKELENRTMKDK